MDFQTSQQGKYWRKAGKMRYEKAWVKTKELMRKYADLPMDYADATLVAIAIDTGIRNIITFDKKDFGIYTLPNRKKFIIAI